MLLGDFIYKSNLELSCSQQTINAYNKSGGKAVVSMDYIFNHLDEDITASYLIDIGKIINRNINEISSFRTASVFILGAEHIPPAAADVPRLINELIYTSFKSEDFLYDLADFHIRYERIHPFGDGNGRSGRVLMNKIALSEGYVPFVITKEERTRYMNLLADCNIEGLKKMIGHKEHM